MSEESHNTQNAQARHNIISRKVNKLVDTTGDDALHSSLEFVSSMSAENSAGCRKALRGTLESRVLELHKHFVAEFSAVNGAFTELQESVNELSSTTEEVREVVDSAISDSQKLVSAVSLLRAELDEVRDKERQAEKFIEEYQLSAAEQEILSGEAITPQFIEVLHRARSIRRQCRDMLAVEHQQAAIEVMESIYMSQIAAYEKLTRHLIAVSSEILASDSLPDINDFFLSAVDALRDRPAQRMKVLHEVARVRRGAVIRRFFTVLTKGREDGSKALESLLPDTVRFITEALTWLHHCLAEESDLVSCFFSHGSVDDADDLPAIDIRKEDILDQIFEGVCKHIEGRFDAALQPHMAVESGTGAGIRQDLVNVTTLFRCDGLLSFYGNTISGIVGESASITTMLQGVKLQVLKAFFDKLRSITEKCMSSDIRLEDDLSLPAEIRHLLHILKEMMDAVQSSMMPHAQRESEVGPVLSAIIDPIPNFTKSIEIPPTLVRNLYSGRGNENESQLEEEELAQPPVEFVELIRLAFRLNVFMGVQQVLQPFIFAEKKMQRVDELIKADVDELSFGIAAVASAKFGFSNHLKQLAANEKPPQEDVQTTLRSFSTLLFNVGNLGFPLVGRISNAAKRAEVEKRVSGSIVGEFETIYRYVEDTLCGGDAAKAKEIAIHTPGDVKLLLPSQ